VRTALVSGLLLVTLAGSCADARAHALMAQRHATSYSLSATSRCLLRQGATVGRIVPLDRRLRALRDLAQRNSIQAVFGKARVGIAFARSQSQAKLLVELLTVPKDPYLLVRRANVVFLYKLAQKRAFTAAVSCLRA
jgi:hypothetical protein